MSPVQLLEETEKAVGNPELFQQHTALIRKNDEMKKLQLVSLLALCDLQDSCDMPRSKFCKFEPSVYTG